MTIFFVGESSAMKGLHMISLYYAILMLCYFLLSETGYKILASSLMLMTLEPYRFDSFMAIYVYVTVIGQV